MRACYRELMGLTRAVARQAEAVSTQLGEETRRHGTGAVPTVVEKLRHRLHDTAGLVRRVLAQTRARILKGDTHLPGQGAEPL